MISCSSFIPMCLGHYNVVASHNLEALLLALLLALVVGLVHGVVKAVDVLVSVTCPCVSHRPVHQWNSCLHIRPSRSTPPKRPPILPASFSGAFSTSFTSRSTSCRTSCSASPAWMVSQDHLLWKMLCLRGAFSTSDTPLSKVLPTEFSSCWMSCPARS